MPPRFQANAITDDQSSGLLRALLDESSDQIYAVDLDTAAIIECNEGACRELGYTREQLLAMTVPDIDPTVSPEQWPALVPRFKAMPAGAAFTTTHRRRDGTVFPAEVRNRNIVFDGRAITISAARDITYRKELEGTLRETQRQYESLLRHLPGVVYRYGFGETPQVFWLGEGVREVTGYTADQFRSGEIRLRDLIVPEDRQRVGETLRAAATAGTTFDITYHITHREGRRRTVRDTATGVPPAQPGAQPTLEGIFYDITERAESERLLREAWLDEHERYEFVVAATGQIVYEWDMEKGTMTWSDGLRDVLGYSELQHPYTSEDWASRLHPDDRGATIAAASESAARDGRIDIEYRFRHADGSYRWVWDKATYRRDAAGRYTLARGLLQDISRRKELEAQVSSSQRMETIGALAGGVAHDVNNYLTTIMGNLDLALMRLDEGGDEWAELQDAREAAAGCAELVQSLLTFARQQSPVRSSIDLAEVVRESTRMMQRLAGGEVILRTEADAQAPPVEADRVQVQQVLMNLVANARDALGAGGEVVVATGYERRRHAGTGRMGKFGWLSVSDSGPGIPSELRGRVFEPYFTTRTFGGGTGLGLSIVHGIARAHGGWAEVADASEGIGARIVVWFPAGSG